MANRKIIWTEEHIQYLRDNYPTQTAHDIADVIGCSDASVTLMARSLGIRKSPEFKKSDFIGRYVKRGRIK